MEIAREFVRKSMGFNFLFFVSFFFFFCFLLLYCDKSKTDASIMFSGVQNSPFSQPVTVILTISVRLLH